MNNLFNSSKLKLLAKSITEELTANVSMLIFAIGLSLSIGVGCSSEEHQLEPKPKAKTTVDSNRLSLPTPPKQILLDEKQQELTIIDQTRRVEHQSNDSKKHTPNSKLKQAIGAEHFSESDLMANNMGFGGLAGGISASSKKGGYSPPIHPYPLRRHQEQDVDMNFNTEGYNFIEENDFLSAKENALSTFSIDVDKASYSNVRRFLDYGSLPQKDAVRIEELINYFTYDYPQPNRKHPFSITTELSECAWNPKHQLVHIGLQGKKMDLKDLAPSNLVFLLDVSGSMNTPNRLPLVKESLKLLVNQLRENDYVSIVVYAGAAGLVLPPTSGENKNKIIEALTMLEAGGSTAGGEGLELAYKTAMKHFIKGGNNRVILCTDGDFNVGVSSDAELVRLIENKRKTGIYLTVLGYGMGNYKDSKMEQLADKGNGNYAYIDNLQEAKKTLVTEFGGTLFTIAKDVKIQVEFNPAKVKSYRLIGYENRKLKKEDFNDDSKDAGEIGSGHSVTALYEIVPVGVGENDERVDKLKYQSSTVNNNAESTDELMTVKFRYKQPDSETSTYLDVPVLESQLVTLSKSSNDFRFASSVAMFGMLLRESQHKGESTYDMVFAMAKNAKGNDPEGYRTAFLDMIRKANQLANPVAQIE